MDKGQVWGAVKVGGKFASEVFAPFPSLDFVENFQLCIVFGCIPIFVCMAFPILGVGLIAAVIVRLLFRTGVELEDRMQWAADAGYGEAKQEFTTAVSTNGLSEKDFKALIYLCHPDKHGNSVASTKATQMLLGLRASS